MVSLFNHTLHSESSVVTNVYNTEDCEAAIKQMADDLDLDPAFIETLPSDHELEQIGSGTMTINYDEYTHVKITLVEKARVAELQAYFGVPEGYLKVIDASTGHLEECDIRALDAAANMHPDKVWKRECGYLVLCPTKTDSDEDDIELEDGAIGMDLSNKFMSLIRHCRNEDAYYINLDRDAPMIELPLTEDDFYRRYTLSDINVSDLDSEIELRETSGPDYLGRVLRMNEEVLRINKETPKRVWSVVKIDEKLWLSAGYHDANGLYNLITDEEWLDENEKYLVDFGG